MLPPAGGFLFWAVCGMMVVLRAVSIGM